MATKMQKKPAVLAQSVTADREAWQTVVNRLRELRGLTAGFKAQLKPVKKLVDEILAFAEAQ